MECGAWHLYYVQEYYEMCNGLMHEMYNLLTIVVVSHITYII